MEKPTFKHLIRKSFNMKRTLLYLCSLSLLVMSFTCASDSSSSSGSVLEEVAVADASTQRTSASSDEDIQDNRKLIKTGNLELEVKNIAETETKIRDQVNAYSGYIASEKETNYDYRHSVNIVARIPASSFDSFINDLQKEFKQFEKKDIVVSDVTEEFLDVTARSKTKKALEERYIRLLAQAKNVKEIIEVESELATIRGDIEQMEGRLNYLKNQTAYSTIAIRFYKNTPSSPVVSTNRFVTALQNGWKIVVELSLLLVTIWPLLIMGAAFGWWLLKRRKKATKKA